MSNLQANPIVCNTADNPIDRVVEIERLAALDPIDYEVARGEAAQQLGMRAAILDNEVKKKRRALGLEESDDTGQGRAVKIQDVAPWPDPIEGDDVASALSATIKRYAVLPEGAADTIALWILFTWAIDKFSIAPRLAVTSPTKGCGKTTVLRLLAKLTYRPLKSGSVSPAALFRAIEQIWPTMILDENEKYLETGSDLHALLNEGHLRDGSEVMRVLGEKQELRLFSTFCAVAFARNGRIPDDLEQRSIVIEMQRRRLDEPLDEIREDRCGNRFHNLARMCARWADDYAAEVADADPGMTGVINRIRDNWRPLFTVADVVGSDWPTRIREAAIALAPRETDSTNTLLLADIKAAFDEKNIDRITSTDLCEALAAMEGRPWPEYGRTGKPITPNQLAKLLRPFGIVTNTTIRIGSKTAKGYRQHEFQALWDRYLVDPLGEKQSHGNNADGMGTSGTFQKVTATVTAKVTVTDEKGDVTGDVTDEKCEKPASNGHCYRVTDENGVGPGFGTGATRKCSQCGKDGAELEAHYGEASAWLHRGACEDAWRTARDLDDLTIPSYLDRRPGARAES